MGMNLIIFPYFQISLEVLGRFLGDFIEYVQS